MTECDQDNCGCECPVFLRGDCDFADEMLDGASEEDRQLYFSIYGSE